MILDRVRKIECTWDGQTVWVNMAGAAIARFGRYGTDIHAPADITIETGKTCLYCTHETATAESWDTFVTKMREIHGVRIPAASCPPRLKVAASRLAKSV